MSRLPLFSLVVLLSLTLSSCDFIGDILEFSFWTLLIVVVLVVALVVWGFKKLF